MKIEIVDTPNINSFEGLLESGGAMFPTGITHINSGGSHESNPNEGVQVGIDSNGTPNLVEEGETIVGDYVFSKRLNVPQKFLKENKFKEGGTISFAEASKIIEKRNMMNENPNDPINRRGFQSEIEKLKAAQEEVRAKKQEREMMAQQMAIKEQYENQMAEQEMMNEQMPEEEQMIGQDQMQGIEPQGEYGEEMMAYGGNLFKRGSRMDKINNTAYDRDWFLNRAIQNGYVDYGTKFNDDGSLVFRDGLGSFKYTDGDWRANFENFNNIAYKAQENRAREYYKAGHNGSDVGFVFNPNEFNKLEPNIDRQTSWASNLRYAPALGNAALFLHSVLSKPDYSRARMLLRDSNNMVVPRIDYDGTYMRYNPFDREYHANRMESNINSMRTNALNSFNPSRFANAMAINNNGIEALGKLYREGEEYNFNIMRDITNANNAINAQRASIAAQNASNFMTAQKERNANKLLAYNMMDQIDADKSKTISANFTNMLNSLGQIGEEIYSRDDMNWLISKGYFPSGYTPNKAMAKANEEKLNKSSNGGKLLTRRK